MSEKLKPCPKCGGPTRLEAKRKDGWTECIPSLLVCVRSDELVEDCPGERRKSDRHAPQGEQENNQPKEDGYAAAGRRPDADGRGGSPKPVGEVGGPDGQGAPGVQGRRSAGPERREVEGVEDPEPGTDAAQDSSVLTPQAGASADVEALVERLETMGQKLRLDRTFSRQPSAGRVRAVAKLLEDCTTALRSRAGVGEDDQEKI